MGVGFIFPKMFRVYKSANPRRRVLTYNPASILVGILKIPSTFMYVVLVPPTYSFTREFTTGKSITHDGKA